MNKQENNILCQAEEEYLANVAADIYGQELLQEFLIYVGQTHSPLPKTVERPPFPLLSLSVKGRSTGQGLTYWLHKRPTVTVIALLITMIFVLGCTFSVIRFLTGREGAGFADHMAVTALPTEFPYSLAPPMGYTIEYCNLDQPVQEIILSDSEGNNIFLFLSPIGHTISSDSDVLEQRPIRLKNGTEAYLSTIDSGYCLLWAWDNHIFVLEGDLPQDTLITLANSVKKKK